jgi:hypothetical protein
VNGNTLGGLHVITILTTSAQIRQSRTAATSWSPANWLLGSRKQTNLYNQRPTWLANLHAALDRAVWTAYGWDDPDPAMVPEDDILARLLALNLKRAAGA